MRTSLTSTVSEHMDVSRASQSGGLSHSYRPRVLLGVTGGIAAYKSAILVRELKKRGADVVVVPTPAALEMVGRTTWEALSGNPVHVYTNEAAHEVVHVNTGAAADLLIIAPATANTLAKLAHGLADNLLTNSALVATCPVVLAPAMHTQMWENPATQANIATLNNRGYYFIGPEDGQLTGADSGVGRMSEPVDIARFAWRFLDTSIPSAGINNQPVAGASDTPVQRKIISISAGGTHEPIDPVRFIGNRSTGRMGVSLANAAVAAGYTVRLAAANISHDVLATLDPSVSVTPVVTAGELHDQMTTWASDSDVVIMAAAVADFRAKPSATKIKRGGSLTLELTANPDILADLAQHRRRADQIVVGFAAETGDSTTDFVAFGKEKARRKGADLLAINLVGATVGFGDVATRLIIVDGAGDELRDVSGSKDAVARALIATIDERLNWKNPERQ